MDLLPAPILFLSSLCLLFGLAEFRCFNTQQFPYVNRYLDTNFVYFNNKILPRSSKENTDKLKIIMESRYADIKGIKCT